MNHPNCYNTQNTDVFQSGFVTRQPGCTDWIAINKGAVGVRINGIYLKPYPPGHPELSGESFSPDVKAEASLYIGDFDVVFDAGVGPWLQLVQIINVKRQI